MDGISIEDARRTLGDIADRARVAGQAALITRYGKPAAVVVPVDWFEQAASLLSTLPPRRGYEQYQTVRLDGDLTNDNVTNLSLRKLSGEVEMKGIMSLTLVSTDWSGTIPGFDAEQAGACAFMHDPAVRRWIADAVAAGTPGGPARILIADDEWVNPGGTESLTLPAGPRDMEAVEGIRRQPRVTWETIAVQASNPSTGYTATEAFYKAWRDGHPLLAAYGDTPRDAITAQLNKYGE